MKEEELINKFIDRAEDGWMEAINKLPEVKDMDKESFKAGFVQGVKDVILFVGENYELKPKIKR